MYNLPFKKILALCGMVDGEYKISTYPLKPLEHIIAGPYMCV